MLDEFSERRFKELAVRFVDMYTEESDIAAAKLIVDENIPEKDYAVLRELVNTEFLARGWTFDD